jgi:hypothetical protein
LCGRRRVGASVHHDRSHHGLYLLCHCVCGMEWTERQAADDLLALKTSSEVVELHALLARLKDSMVDLRVQPSGVAPVDAAQY